jgi:hypothetical protein
VHDQVCFFSIMKEHDIVLVFPRFIPCCHCKAMLGNLWKEQQPRRLHI